MRENPLNPAVLVTINTGLRAGELVALRWENIDLKAELLTAIGSTAKSIQTRHVPLNSDVIAVPKRWQKQSTYTERVLPVTRFKKSWTAIFSTAD